MHREESVLELIASLERNLDIIYKTTPVDKAVHNRMDNLLMSFMARFLQKKVLSRATDLSSDSIAQAKT